MSMMDNPTITVANKFLMYAYSANKAMKDVYEDQQSPNHQRTQRERETSQ